MADVHDKATRSKNMRAIGTRDTAIEQRVAALLTECGFAWTAQQKTCLGVPTLPSTNTAASSLHTAVSGITMTAISLKSPPRARSSG